MTDPIGRNEVLFPVIIITITTEIETQSSKRVRILRPARIVYHQYQRFFSCERQELIDARDRRRQVWTAYPQPPLHGEARNAG